MQIQVGKGISKAEAERFYKALCSATHHFVYGDIQPAWFMFNDPESACRTCGGLGVHKLTHPELLIPDPEAQHPRRVLRPRGVPVQPRYVGRRDDVQPEPGVRLLARHALERAPAKTRDQILNGIEDKVLDGAPPEAKGARRDERRGQDDRLRRDRTPHRAALPAVPPARGGQLQHGGVARQGDGRAHVPGLQRRARSRDAAARSRSAARRFTMSASCTSTSSTRSWRP